MQLNRNSNAQGTIEYLVILSIVIVIGLVVVGMLVSINDSQDITQKNDKLKNTIGTGGISVLEAVLDPNGNAIITLKNLGPDSLTITSLTGGTLQTDFDQPQTGFGELTFYLTDLNSYCTCNETIKTTTCSFNIRKTNKYGNSETIPVTIPFVCVGNTTPTNPEKVIGLGSGTQTDPFIINSCLELQAIDENLTAHYKLGANIDCSDTTNWNAGAGFTPIGNSTTKFSGSFNGNSKTISNLFIYRPTESNVGLFGYTNASVIQNTGLIDNNITGKIASGGLIGYNLDGNVINNYTTGSLRGMDAGGSSSAGGLIGYNTNGTITSNYTTGNTIGAYTNVGGLIGRNDYGIITNNYTTGNTTGTYTTVGGLIGMNFAGTATANYTTGNTTGTSWNTGGLIGYNWHAIVSQNYTTGNTTGGQDTGGLIGNNEGNGETISNNYTTGFTNGTNWVGGLIGYQLYTSIANNYTLGDTNGATNVGGITGYHSTSAGTFNYNYIIGSVTGTNTTNAMLGDYGSWSGATGNYYDTTLTGQTTCHKLGNSGCSTTADQESNYFGPSGIPFANDKLNWSTSIWTARDNNHPILAWQN
ncbi:MAG: hypothetical protein WC915_02650 [archaeon]|jgi:hypothetical protein